MVKKKGQNILRVKFYTVILNVRVKFYTVRDLSESPCFHILVFLYYNIFRGYLVNQDRIR